MKKNSELNLKDLHLWVSKAVSHFWQTREKQFDDQKKRGSVDQGNRSMVTGGAQMDGFIELISTLITESGIPEKNIFYKKALELPGYFRPTKEWDLLVIRDDQLIIALEAKSQVGPSFGNNFNNRTEEALGSAIDIWTAYREKAFNTIVRPWLGYLIIIEDCIASQKPVKVKEPHFKVFPEFTDSSYQMRYMLFCQKLIRERHYNASAFLKSNRQKGLLGDYQCPLEEISISAFIRSLIAQIIASGF